MCEPHHSIVQYPTQDPDSGDPTAPVIDAIPEGWWGGLKRRIRDWFHFSKLGLGHSEAIGRMTPAARRRIPADTLYEAAWWNRTVSRDGPYRGHAFDSDLALAAATEYANKVSVGNLHLLRQFLEQSMRKSLYWERYFDQFSLMLNAGGRDAFNNQLRMMLKLPKTATCYAQCLDIRDKKEQILRLMLGFTRKRNLLVPEWADDSDLWKPSTTILLPAR